MEDFDARYKVREAVSGEVGDKRTDESARCPKCGASVPSDAEICPCCGNRLVSYCTFCGAPMDWSDDECPECGQPSSGIVCPDCGTLNFRSFCRCCGKPLTRPAVRALERAAEDPGFIRCQALFDKVRSLETDLEAPDASEKTRLEYAEAVTSLNDLFAQMLPPAGSTPQEQRNYFTARKVAVKIKTVSQKKIGWVCNYCGCTHDKPAECTKPQLGGRWIYEDVVEEHTEYKKL